ncbi:MAG: dihydroneopterin triphosphate diphosphatase [Gammaproteobacteria bacterium]|nr:dihydroneopterin triphosphate diphosphatase [Gammaproteobacteria bacterium]MDH4316283.1 dihydroneopterin triphosphate diphosphatase [Gammaproteobacteria bacterium]MDH5215508.1 dihydroneopterin triphosphate diphosphatase [Gammaproteobacteria bacterium]
MNRPTFRRPVSVLIVVYTDAGEVLLLRRSKPFDFWQSVTGSLDAGEKHAQAAARELREETGLSNEGELRYSGVSRQFVIDPRWRHKYQPGIVENVEFEWRYRLPGSVPIRVQGNEHSKFGWFSIDDAIDKVWSWTNREALRQLRLELAS